jgi:hypothetical protein
MSLPQKIEHFYTLLAAGFAFSLRDRQSTWGGTIGK